jgi:hypothetical protein
VPQARRTAIADLSIEDFKHQSLFCRDSIEMTLVLLIQIVRYAG